MNIRRPIWRATSLLLRCGGPALALLWQGCGPRLPGEGPYPGSIHNDSSLVAGPRVERIATAGRPTLHMIRRQGDPLGAVALSVFPPGGSAASLQLGRLMETRLSAFDDDQKQQISVHALGFVIAREVSSPDQARAWIDSVYRALTTPVSKEELTQLRLSTYLKTAASRSLSASPYADCMAELGAEGRAPLKEALSALGEQQETLEKLRQASIGAGRVGLAALGPTPLLEAVAQGHDREWPRGVSPDDTWSAAQQVAVTESAGGRELKLAVRVNDASSALAAARALQDKDHALHARLHALDTHLGAGELEVVLRPAGACAGITVRIASESPPPTPHSLSQAAIVVQDELMATLGQSLTEDELNLAIIAPQGALESAALGAWTAVRSERTGGQMGTVVEYRAPTEDPLSAEEFKATLRDTHAQWAKRRLQVVTASEVGQQELWMLVATPCGAIPEPAEETGLRALSLSSLARHFDGHRGVALSPWVTADAMGLVAHAPPLRGETARRHAERVARALGIALSGPPLDGRVVARERAAQLQRVGSDPGETLITSLLGGGSPSMVQPWGNEKSVATQSTADVEHARQDISRESLRLAVLESAEGGQGAAAQAALSAWLAPFRSQVTACGKTPAEPPAPGVWDLETIDEHVQTGAYIGVWSPTARPLGKATEYLLNRPNGYLKNALLVPGLAASAEARWIGDHHFGGLMIRVGAQPAELERAVQQTRALLDRLSQGALSEADARLAEQRYETIEAEVARLPAGRLVKLWLDDAKATQPTQVDASTLRALLKTLKAEQHRVVKVRRRE